MEKFVAVTSEKVSNHIPDDLAFSILSKLPLKSLKRFGCVYKSWALLFENPHFMSMYRNNFISNNHSYYDDTSLLLLQNAKIMPGCHNVYSMLYLLSGERFENKVKLDWPPPFQEDDSRIIILGPSSINGILCLCVSNRVVLWNPATEEFKFIPPSPVESLPYKDAMVFLPRFGYDHVRDDYKVIQDVSRFPITNVELEMEDGPMVHHYPFWEIYSLRQNSWRKLDVDMPSHYQGFGCLQLYMDGLCHWFVTNENRINGEAYLVSFDFSNEVFFTTPIPSGMDCSSDFGWVERHLVMLNGSIALISNYAYTTTFHISILGELGVKESWTKLFIVGPLPSCIMHPIEVGKKGDIFFKQKNGELAWFDLSIWMIEELGVKGGCQIAIYKESHLPIGGINN